MKNFAIIKLLAIIVVAGGQLYLLKKMLDKQGYQPLWPDYCWIICLRLLFIIIFLLRESASSSLLSVLGIIWHSAIRFTLGETHRSFAYQESGVTVDLFLLLFSWPVRLFQLLILLLARVCCCWVLVLFLITTFSWFLLQGKLSCWHHFLTNFKARLIWIIWLVISRSVRHTFWSFSHFSREDEQLAFIFDLNCGKELCELSFSLEFFIQGSLSYCITSPFCLFACWESWSVLFST